MTDERASAVQRAGPAPVQTPSARIDWGHRLVAALNSKDEQLRTLFGGNSVALERFKTVALHSAMGDTSLQGCDPMSIVEAIRESAVLGLEPSGLLGEAFIEPRGGKARLKPMYRGYLKLVRNSGEVAAVDCAVVYEHDDFEVRKGTDPGIRHIPFLNAPLGAGEDEPDRGAIRGAYAWARLNNGELLIEWMPAAELEKARRTSEAGKRGTGPWETWYSEMSRKTVLRRLCKYLPTTPAVRRLLGYEAQLDAEDATRPTVAVKDPSRAALAALAASGQLSPTEEAGADTESAEGEPEASEEPGRHDPEVDSLVDLLDAT